MSDPINSPQRKIIYRPTNSVGIRSVWDWSDERRSYVQRRGANRFLATVERAGRTKSSSFDDLKAACLWREKTRYELERLPNFESMNFQELFENFLSRKSQNCQISTIESYRSLGRYFETLLEVSVEDFNSKRIDAWLELIKSGSYRRERKMRSVRESFRHEITLLRNVFGYYKEYFNETFENPVRERHDRDSILDPKAYDQKRRSRKKRFIAGEEIEMVLSVFHDQVLEKPGKAPYFTKCLIQLRTGMRIGEVCALRWEDINWDSGTLTVNKTVQWMRIKSRPSLISDRTKTGEERIVQLLPDVLKNLRDLQRRQARIAGLIFSDDGSRIVAYRSVQHHYGSAFERAGVDYRSTHILRHSFATHFLECTLNPVALKALLGHADLKMTEKYAKPTERTAISGMLAYQEALEKKPERT